MGKFRCHTIQKIENCGASAFLFDLRNSTKITRSLTFKGKFQDHVEYMKELHKFIYSTIYGKYSTGSDRDEFALNDTGDGYLCVFWGKAHALYCMKMALEIRNRLHETLPPHNKKLGLKDPEKLNFGFSIHTAAVDVERVNFNDKGGRLIHKDFILGILPNSVARLESLNKLYTDFNFLASGNYKDCFIEQAKQNGKDQLASLFDENNKFVHKSNGRININDGKKKGHYIYTVGEIFFEEFKKHYN